MTESAHLGAARSQDLRREMLRSANHVLEYAEGLLERANAGTERSAAADLERIRQAALRLLVGVNARVVPEIALGRADPSVLDHELRTPLNTIVGYAQLVLDDLARNGASPLAADLERIGRAGGLLQSLVDDVIDLARDGAAERIVAGPPVRAGDVGVAGARVLVVDDAKSEREIAMAWLIRAGHDVITADGGPAALAAIAVRIPDLLVLDMVMPGMDGYEVCRRVRADSATAGMTVLMVTPPGEHEQRRSIEAGADDFIARPLRELDLVTRVRALVRTRSNAPLRS